MIDQFVLLYIHSPRELVFGYVQQLSPAGIAIRGIPVDQIETFKYQFKNEEHSVFFQTVFYPMHRVERVIVDERQGKLPSTLEDILAASQLSESEIRNL
ncbi:MAG: hypothetical protein CR997_00660 [Acidobacteria bacterium]|nr:MAG: hypothetical protein CR997_00660 [Acidobacteriota bacterium]